MATKNYLKQFKLWGPILLVYGMILIPSLPIFPKSLSGIGGVFTPGTISNFVLAKSGHLIMYAILTFFIYRAISKSFKMNRKQTYIWSGTLALLFGIFDEVQQFFIPGRYGKIEDVFINSLAILIALLIINNYKTSRYIRH